MATTLDPADAGTPLTRTIISERDQIILNQRRFFNSQRTLDLDVRIDHLTHLQQTLKREEPAILAALTADLGKAPFEGYATELGLVLEEIRFTLQHIHQWARPQKVPTPLVHFPSTSWIYPEPLGLVLILSPWNYPLLLTLAPLVAAIAAGNCVTLKPSRYALQTALLMEQILHECFEPEYVSIFQSGDDVNDWLMATRFDHIFFTGSPRVGRTVMAAAAKHLTPVSLELGGKSPCIVDQTANVDLAARRIAWGKCVNSGQTCVAPDYFLVHKDVKAALVNRIQFYLRQFYGENPLTNPEYPKIVNARQFERLCGLMAGLKVLCGGRVDPAARKIEPTLFDEVTLDAAIMQEEIFGPLLPILEFERREQALEIIHHFEKPLALYLFTRDQAFEKQVLASVSFGGGCVNDTLIHLSNPNLPFGGVGESGMGSYHGVYGFRTFSHLKSVVKKANWLDIPTRYPPFADRLNLLRKLLR